MNDVYNPGNAPAPGNGWRFLDKDERKTRRRSRHFQAWYLHEWYEGAVSDGLMGYNKRVTYRTKLTREQVARLP